MKILLVDDNKLFLSGLSNLLEENGHIVVGSATSGAKTLPLVSRLRPELVLMDVQMPEQDGIETTRILKRRHPLLKIIMMTISESDEYLFDAIAAGASGYLIKDERPDLFLEALAGVARGETPLSPGLAGKIMAEFARREQKTKQPAASTPSMLSERQIKILRRVAEGRPYREIADQLGLTERTIKYHMGEIVGRLHLENRSQVIAYASRYLPETKCDNE